MVKKMARDLAPDDSVIVLEFRHSNDVVLGSGWLRSSREVGRITTGGRGSRKPPRPHGGV